MKKGFIIFLFMICSVFVFAQKTDQEFCLKASKEYINGDFTKSCETINAGLKIFPNSDRLKKIKKLLINCETPVEKPEPSTAVNVEVNKTEKDKVKIEKIEKITIDADLQRIPKQNKVEWSEDLASNAKQLTIVFTNQTNGVEFVREVVTGSNNYYYSPNTSDAQGVPTKVELIVEIDNSKFIVKGTKMIKDQFFKCK
jgi:hypothetical protein